MKPGSGFGCVGVFRMLAVMLSCLLTISVVSSTPLNVETVSDVATDNSRPQQQQQHSRRHQQQKQRDWSGLQSAALRLNNVTDTDRGAMATDPESQDGDPSQSSSGLAGSTAAGLKPKHRLIRGSKKAVTITRKEYLKTDWCKTEPFQQIIHVEGCLRSRILNRFCYGQCNSFFIPKSEPELTGGSASSSSTLGDDEDELAAYASPEVGSAGGHFRSCAVCTPKSVDWATVVLRCPRLVPPFRRKRIRVVRQCKCMAVRLDGY